MTPRLVANLTEFVGGGGDLLLEARLARVLPETLAGLRFSGQAKGVLSVDLRTGESFEELPCSYTVAERSTASMLLAGETGNPLLTVNRVGAGRIIFGTPDRWVSDRLTYRRPELVNRNRASLTSLRSCGRIRAQCDAHVSLHGGNPQQARFRFEDVGIGQPFSRLPGNHHGVGPGRAIVP